jgi:hypothetical protein
MAGALTNRQGEMLLELARKTLAEILTSGTVAAEPDDPALAVIAAAFVTLKIGGKLRGCIGNLEPVGPLWRGVRDNAINAAFHDPRFSPLTPKELAAVRLDVSVLSPPKSLEYRETEETPARNRRSDPAGWSPRGHLSSPGLAAAAIARTVPGTSLYESRFAKRYLAAKKTGNPHLPRPVL